MKNSMAVLYLESGSERIPRSLLRGKRANGEHYYSLWIEDSPQFTAESFNILSPSLFNIMQEFMKTYREELAEFKILDNLCIWRL